MTFARTLLSIDGRPTCFVVADLTGAAVTGTVLDHDAAASPAVLDLRDGASLSALAAAIEREAAIREPFHAERLPFNEATLAVRSFAEVRRPDGSREVRLQLVRSRYSRFVAALEALSGLPLDRRLELALSLETEVPSPLAHASGVNVTLETADGRMVWVRRPSTTTVAPGALASAMNEGVSAEDGHGGTWDPMRTIVRGFREELALGPEDFPEGAIHVHSLLSQCHLPGLVVAAHAVTSLTAAEVVDRHAGAVDGSEAAGGLLIGDASANGVAEVVASGGPLADWLPVSVMGLRTLRWPDLDVPRLGELLGPAELVA